MGQRRADDNKGHILTSEGKTILEVIFKSRHPNLK